MAGKRSPGSLAALCLPVWLGRSTGLVLLGMVCGAVGNTGTDYLLHMGMV